MKTVIMFLMTSVAIISTSLPAKAMTPQPGFTYSENVAWAVFEGCLSTATHIYIGYRGVPFSERELIEAFKHGYTECAKGNLPPMVEYLGVEHFMMPIILAERDARTAKK